MLDPLGKRRVTLAGEGHDRLARGGAIAAQVVAALDRERTVARIAPQLERGNDRAENRLGLIGLRAVMLDIGVGQIKPAGFGVDEIAALGHGQRHDADRGICHRGNQRRVVFGDGGVVDHRADDLCRDTTGGKLDQGGQIVLRFKLVAHRAVIGPHTGADQRPILRQTLLHQLVQIPRLMGAVEIAQTDVDDPRRERGAIVVGRADTGGQVTKAIQGQRHRRRRVGVCYGRFIHETAFVGSKVKGQGHAALHAMRRPLASKR